MTSRIVVEDLGRRFRKFGRDRPNTFQEALQRGLRGVLPEDYFWALRHVSFDVEPGQTLGVIGRNGAGKSTLLRLLGRVGRPDEGRVHVHGRLGALLELGAGFHPDLSGRENVVISAIVNGLTRRDALARLDAIVAFSELGDFIDAPVRTYSDGMKMRLAFSTAVHSDLDVLLIDEVLAVGDQAFQQKCVQRIEEIKCAGCTIVMASHDSGLTQQHCDAAIWLQSGSIAAQGPAALVVGRYLAG